MFLLHSGERYTTRHQSNQSNLFRRLSEVKRSREEGPTWMRRGLGSGEELCGVHAEEIACVAFTYPLASGI